MRETKRELDPILARSFAHQGLVGIIAIHLNGAAIIGKLPARLIVTAPAGMDIGNCRMRRSRPWPVITGVSPELRDAHPSSAFLQNRHSRLITENARLLVDIGEQALMERA